MTRRCLVFALLACAGGCLWRSYGTIMAVHLDVLTQTAAKLCAVVEAGKGPTTEGMAEYVYPAKRAREFLRQFSSYSERPSYRKFSVLLDRYEAIVRDIDAARARGKVDTQHLPAERDALQALAVEVRAELKVER